MKAAEMRATLSRWRDSGLSLRAFAKSEGASYAKLIYWRRKLEAETSEPVDLARLHIVPDPEKPGLAETVAVWLPNGISLEVPTNGTVEGLRHLVETLAQC